MKWHEPECESCCSNRHILWFNLEDHALFIAMAVYFGWFIQFK